VGTLHPLIAVTEAPGAMENLRGASFGIEGDEPATRLAHRLVRLMGGRPLPLASDSMALYHAAAVMASNYVVALTDIARSMLVAAGVPEKDALPALIPLLTSAIRNVAEVGLPSAMTGPVVRGDVVSIERHIAAIEARAPETMDLYQRLGREVLRIARRRVPDLDDRAVEQMAAIFGSGTAPEPPREPAPTARKKRS
jgi:predicted short-subunit dehydrogenase-like oxidoreductase (DUF2520 family)